MQRSRQRAREKPAPVPAKRNEDERAVIEELARLTLDDDAEIEEDASFLRPGLPRDILRQLPELLDPTSRTKHPARQVCREQGHA